MSTVIPLDDAKRRYLLYLSQTGREGSNRDAWAVSDCPRRRDCQFAQADLGEVLAVKFALFWEGDFIGYEYRADCARMGPQQISQVWFTRKLGTH